MSEDKLYDSVKEVIEEYLIANKGWDGWSKGDAHQRLCEAYTRAYIGEETLAKIDIGVIVYRVRKISKDLTDNLDKEIGFIINEYQKLDKLVPMFYTKFKTLVDPSIDYKVTRYLKNLEEE